MPVFTALSNGVYQTRPAPERDFTVVRYSIDLANWDDGFWADPKFLQTVPEDIDDPWPYRFKRGNSVWIRADDGEWYRGTVLDDQPMQGMTKHGMGLWWVVEFFARDTNIRLRQWFAPLNGEVKPDDYHTEALLANSDWEAEYYLQNRYRRS